MAVPTFAAAYQFGCDQFGFPTLPVLWGMTGTLVPWWGWLLVAAVGFVYAMFEYIRVTVVPALENVAAAPSLSAAPLPDVTKIASAPTHLPRMSPPERARMSVALTEVEDFLRDRFPAFIDAPRLGKFKRTVERGGPQPLRESLEAFAVSVTPFATEFERLISRHETELRIADIDLKPLRIATGYLDAPARDAARFLSKLPRDSRDPDLVESHMHKAGERFVEVREQAKAMLEAVRAKRVELATGG